MIEAGPNVPNALVEIIEKRAGPANATSLQAPSFLVWAKNGRVGLAIRLETQQPAVLRIEIEEKIIANLNKLRRSNAIGRESQYLVGAITVVIDQMLDDSRGTGLVTYPQCQTGKQIRSNRRLEAAQLAPGDN